MANLPIKQQGSFRIRYIIGFSVLIIAIFSMIVTYQSNSGYEQAVRDSDQKAMRLATILGKHTEVSFLGVDALLRRVIDHQRAYIKSPDKIPQYAEKDFSTLLNETSQIVAISIINGNGEIGVSANKEGYKNWFSFIQTISSQTILKKMRNVNENQVFIGKHYIQGSRAVILMSRRYNNTDGSFGGAIVAAIDPSYFVEFYNSIASGRQKFMSIMFTDDTEVLASGPYNNKTIEALGKNFLSAQDKKTNSSNIDHIVSNNSMKILAIKLLETIPIAVQVTLDEEDYLIDWEQEKIKNFGFLIMFIIFASILSFFAVIMARQVVRVQESEGAAILASQAKSEFLANMSHELRTPLNAIIGFSEMINSGYFGGLNEKQKERIYDINLCGSHLLQLITDILEFSKGEAGKLELFEEQMDINELIDESVRIMKGRIKTKNIDLISEIEPNIPMLWADKRKIRQILINLLSNAFKFTPENGKITVSAYIDGHSNMVMAVADSGVGIPESDIPKALSVFGQVHRSKSHEGTGLGLPLCKMYAELHDGQLVLTSKVGEGTTVKILFPHQRVLPHRNVVHSQDY